MPPILRIAAAQPRAAAPVLLWARGGGALSLRADRAAQVRARARTALAVVGPRRRGRHLPAVRRAGVPERRAVPARPRHRAKPRARDRRVRGHRLELPDALSRQLRGDAVASSWSMRFACASRRSTAGNSTTPGRPSRRSGPSFPSCSLSFASVASKAARRARSCSTTLAGARSTNDGLASFAFAFAISPSRRAISFSALALGGRVDLHVQHDACAADHRHRRR